MRIRKRTTFTITLDASELRPLRQMLVTLVDCTDIAYDESDPNNKVAELIELLDES